ncbi:MAG: ester cyclase [Dyadobacter sp.]
MTPSLKNKEFIIEYLNAASGRIKTSEFLRKYVNDQELIDHILFFDAAFPAYEVIIEEIMAEGNQVIVRARLVGDHNGVFGEILPTNRHVDFPFVVSYRIENNKIVSHWLVADQMAIMQQLGVEQAFA